MSLIVLEKAPTALHRAAATGPSAAGDCVGDPSAHRRIYSIETTELINAVQQLELK